MFDFKAAILKWGPKALPYLAVLAIGLGLGWKLKPDVVQVKETTVTVEKKVVDETLVQQEVDQRVKEIEATKATHVVTVVVTKKDGTKVEKTTTDVKTDTKSTDTQVKTVEKVVTVEKIVTVDKVVEKTITPVLKDWRVGILIGFAPRFDNFASSPIMVGLEVDRRIFGPVSIDLWLMGGSPVTGFQLTNVAGGLGVRIEF